MGIIKSSEASGMQQGAIVLNMGDLRAQADEMKAKARREAQRIVAEAQQQAEKLIADAKARQQQLQDAAREDGYKAGYDQGHAAGLQDGTAAGRQEGHAEVFNQYHEQFQAISQAWANALGQLDQIKRELLLDAKQNLLNLSVRMAEKIVCRVPEIDPGIVVDQLTAAMDYVASPSDVTVMMHPDDRELLEQAMPGLQSEFDNVEHLQLVDDPRITRGGVRLHYGAGRIDATLDTQLQRLVEAMLPGRAELTSDGVHVHQQAEQDMAQTQGNASESDASDDAPSPASEPATVHGRHLPEGWTTVDSQPKQNDSPPQRSDEAQEEEGT